ncbi:succinate dehydrogenase, hydrophobic membrane anchor protein [Neisseriaceae bacterium PsAf]|nr:succinate dehydrogenase, hydrophobic membrane anchor protein [Neisseriaceae bacterium PsAf]MCV2502675.1 succinate dehydrogenase, hydrophobic membrane anchor protein [Neisseriaceae bacterium]
MVDRHLTGAHYGIKDWIFQRLSAVLILVFSIILIIGLFFVPSSYEGWQQFFSYASVKIIAQIIVIAVAIHAWIGVRDIWMDYINNSGLRLLMHTLTFVWLLASFIYSVYVIWGV